ncbi:MAG: hypothetical protein BK997_01410 [Candidatus Micrarchaeum sp. ARMAN-1]|nr:MAG: hypothetical protein BK997_01410 [Candidatus Micrarchaeum sp. ARMAN-1]
MAGKKAKGATSKTSRKSIPAQKRAQKDSDSAIEALNSKPNAENWKSALPLIKKSGAKYYRIFYDSGLKDKDNLKNAYAVLYDSSYKRLFKVPVIEMHEGKIVGATKYLVGLKINNRQ